MTLEVQGGTDWLPELAVGSRELRLSYVCPQCRTPQTINLQPLPWREPTEHVSEDRRRAGAIKFHDVHDIQTQLWCHRCTLGTDVTVSSSK